MVIKKTIGRCIYCGALDDLSDEHAFPESMNGDLIFIKASCKECGKITGQFEQRVTRDMWKPARAALGMKTKRPKKMPQRLALKLVKGGKVFGSVEIPAAKFPALLPMFDLGPAGKYRGDFHANNLKAEEHELRLFPIHSNDQLCALAEAHDADEFEVDIGVYPNDYRRMLCKIAYCCAVAQYGVSNIVEVYVLPAILGFSDDVSQWVGGDGISQLQVDVKATHLAYVWDIEGEIHVRLKLFKDTQTPEYYVIVGRLGICL